MNRRTMGRMVAMNYAISAVISLTGVARQIPWWIAALTFGTFISLGVIGMSWAIPRVRVRSFFGTVVFQVVAIVGIMGGCFLGAILTSMGAATGLGPFDSRFWKVASEIVSSPYVTRSLGLFIALTFAISLTLQISRKLGPGVLLNWLTGKYHEPVEEERIFMFLDLKDSTTHAERLGAVQFSAMVRDCFADLAGPCESTRAEVSHYIGDEAVISWRPDRGLKQGACIRMFFEFESSIAEHADAYMSKYGFVPKFKAGIHVGPVVATEVGDAKSEIVFHGDVMNTTARIQGLCNEAGFDILISRDLADRLEPQTLEWSFQTLGMRELKGRVEPVEVLAVCPDS